MAILRIEKSSNYTVMANYHLRDKTLSCKAKGIMSFMLSLPDEWDYTEMGLVACLKEGRDGVRSMLKELEEHHYLVRRRVRNPNGTMGDTVYDVYEMPVSPVNTGSPCTEKPVLEKPTLEKPTLGKPMLENPTQINTNQSNKEKVSTEVTNTKGAEAPEGDCSPELAKAMRGFEEMRKRLKKPLTNRAKELLLKKLEKMSRGNEEIKIAILDQSTVNGWSGIYELKNGGGGYKSNKGDGLQDMQELYEDAVRAYKEMGFDNG